MNRLRIARLRRLYGLTEAQARIVATLAYGGQP
jgi:hypothetical protein